MSEKEISLTSVEEAPKDFVDKFTEIKQSYEQVQETSDEPKKRGRPRKVHDEADPKPVADVVDEAARVASQKTVDETAVEEDGEADVQDASNKEKSVETETYIPDEFVEAAKAKGMKDETIQALFADSPDFFKSAEPKKAEERKPVEAVKQIEDDRFKPITLNLDPDLHGKDVVEAVNALVKEVNSQKAISKQLAEQNQGHEQARVQSTINAFKSDFDSTLDKMTDELPNVGLSSKLTDQHIKSREQIWQKAFMFSGGNMPTKDDVSDAVAWYVGKQGKKVLEQQIVSKFKLRAKQIGNAPTHKKPSGLTGESGLDRFKQEAERIKARYEA